MAAEDKELESILDQFLNELSKSADAEPLIDDFVRRYPDIANLESELRNALAIAQVFHTEDGTQERLSSINCPHCGNHIRIIEDIPEEREVVCRSCGSSINVDPEVRRISPENTLRSLGRYDLLDELGRGSFGVVYEGIDSDLKRRVAIKMPRQGVFNSEQEKKRFLLEAQNTAQLNHPAIVQVYDVGRADETLYIVCEYIRGLSLSEVLSGRRISFRETAEMMVTICDAIQYSHDQGVIHRDIKPGNILVDFHNRPHVTDFGLARREDAAAITMTRNGEIIGTPAYMSPEQAIGDHRRVDHRSDVYSLGTTLYRILSGELPFRGSQRMLLQQVIRDDPKPIRKINEHVPIELETIALKAMSKQPEERYQSAAEIGAELTRWLNGDPIKARPPGRLERAWKWARKRPMASALIATCSLLLLTGTLWGLREHNLKLASVEQNRVAQEDLSNSYLRQGMDSLNFRSAAECAQYFVNSLAIDESLGHDDNARRTRIRLRQQFHRLPRLVDLVELNGPPVAVALTNEKLYVATDGELVSFQVDTLRREPRFTIAPPKRDKLFVSDSTQRLLVLNRDGSSAQLWDLTTDQLIARLKHDAKLTDVSLSEDGTRIVTVCFDGRARIWNSADGALLHDLTYGENEMITGGRLSPANDYLITWHLLKQNAQCQLHVRKLEPDSDNSIDYEDTLVKDIAFPTDDSVLVGDSSGVVRHFNLSDGKEKARFVHENGIRIVKALRGEEPRLLTLSDSGHTTLWDLKSADRLSQSEHPNAQTLEVAADHSVYVVSGQGLPWFVHWTATGESACDAISPRDGRLKILPNNRQLAFVQDGCLELRDLSGGIGGPIFRQGPEISGGKAYGFFSPDGSLVAGGNYQSKTIRLWNRETHELVAELAHDSIVQRLEFSPDGRTIATGTTKGKVLLWDGQSGDPVGSIQCDFEPDIANLKFISDDGSKLVIGSAEGHVEIRSIDEPEVLLDAWKLPERIYSIAFSSNGQFVTTSDKNNVFIRDFNQKQNAIEPLATQGRIRSTRFSSDDRFLLTSGTDLILWDWKQRQIKQKVPSQRALHAGFSANDEWVCAFDQRNVLVLNAANFDDTMWKFPEPQARTAKFHPSLALLATAGGLDTAGNGIANLWDFQRGVPAGPTFMHRGTVTDVVFSNDGKWLLTPSNDGFIHIWDITPLTASAETLAEYFQLLSGMAIPERNELSARKRLTLFQKLRRNHPQFFSVDAKDVAQWQMKNPSFKFNEE